jgi:CHAT domain-containing protein/Tfp pilus assembly protein PilF
VKLDAAALVLLGWAALTASGMASAQAPEAAPPQPSAAVRPLLEETEALLAARRSPDALHRSSQAFAAADRAQDLPGQARAKGLEARAFIQLNQANAAIAAKQTEANLWQRGKHGPEQIGALIELAIVLERVGSDDEVKALTQVLEAAYRERTRPVQAADVLRWGGVRYLEREAPQPRRERNLVVARGLFAAAATLRQKYQPDSLELAAELANAAEVEEQAQDLPKAQALHALALDIRLRHPAEPLVVAGTLEKLGHLTWQQGDLSEARAYYEGTLAIVKRRLPASAEVAAGLTNLAKVKAAQGDLRNARGDLLEALALWERTAPESRGHAGCLNNLGATLIALGDIEAAGDFLARALALRTKSGDALGVASTQENLGNIALLAGDLPQARRYYESSLRTRDERAPQSILLARSLNNMGTLLERERRYDEAAAHFEAARRLKQRLQPESLSLAATLNNLGEVAARRGDTEAAARYHNQALQLREKLAPDSLELASSLTNLADLAGMRSDWQEAERLARRSWAIVRERGLGVTGDQAVQAYQLSTARHYDVLIRTQLALGQTAAAFRTLEEGRASSLQKALLQRGRDALGPGGERAEAYRTAVLARDQAEFEISRATRQLLLARERLGQLRLKGDASGDVARARADVADWDAKLDKAQAAHSVARTQADQHWRVLTAHVPQLAPGLVEAAQVSQQLGPDTLYAAFVVDREETYVFMVRGGQPPSVSKLGIARDALGELVGRHRALTTRPDSPADKLAASGRRLFATLFPAAARRHVAEAERIVLSPDGSLWDLSFASLITNANGQPAYLGVQKALSYTASLSLLSVPSAGGVPSAWNALVVGHPAFSGGENRAAVRRQEVRSMPGGRAPAPLPHTETEAQQVARLYDSAPLLQRQATEPAVRKRIGEARIVHLATHGYLHPVRAMNSGVLLAAPEVPDSSSSDGVLEAWEVASQLALRADLVVLSACESALGETVPNEGVIGLARAFQMAGARAVVATQWQVLDLSTASFMMTFHRELKAGQAKDHALRTAAASLARSRDTAHPYYWAAIRLLGDRTSPTPPASAR